MSNCTSLIKISNIIKMKVLISYSIFLAKKLIIPYDMDCSFYIKIKNTFKKEELGGCWQ